MTQSNTNPPEDYEQQPLDGIAIIGMAGRFPGAPDLETFWQNLVDGEDTITRFTSSEVASRNFGNQESDFVAARGVLEDAAMFDADYFGVSPREAERTDPQHRVFLEACSNALEDAGYVSSDYHGEIGLFAGCSLNTYLLANLATDRAFLDELTGNYQVGEFQVALGNDKDFLTTRAAYKLDLRGPVVTVQSACATSLVAICQASEALLNFQCDMALAGGVSITFPQHRGHLYQEGGIVSKDGRCRPFDAAATGTVFGHGVGVVLLKRLEDALRDGDHIAAVIRGFAVNNDGSGKAGYMAPSVDGQARVIAAAQAMAGISPESISYVEAHGTGTPLGDPIEIAALTKVFRAATDREGFCRIGTAKGNLGHLDSAAGVTGVIKTVLSLQHRTLPGLNHFHSPNPNIDLQHSPFVFQGATSPWTGASPLRAGVSAFGVGGVNSHLVLEEAPRQTSSVSPYRQQILCVSGRTPAVAQRAAATLADFLAANQGINLADASFTLASGRKAHEFRIAIVASNAGDAAVSLRAARALENARSKIAFLFSGQGTQFVGMGQELYNTQPVYRSVVDVCSELLRPLLRLDLRDLIFTDGSQTDAAARLERTEFAQPAIFVTALALAELWQSWGIRPAAMLGHSLGEYVAATLAGVFSRPDALRLVALRGRMMQALESGAMISVPLDEEGVAHYATAEISTAAFNSPRSSVLSGTIAAIASLEARLQQDGIASRRLRTSHAFHSVTMEPMLADFEHEVAKLELRAPSAPFVSSVTGNRITDEQATSAHYWAQQCRQPVRFREGLATLLADGANLLLEVGPGKTLTTLALQQSPGDRPASAVASFSQTDTIQQALASLWAAGATPDWASYFAGQDRLRVSLPTYPFERKLHWIAPPVDRANSTVKPQENETIAAAPGESPVQVTARTHLADRATQLRLEVAHVLTELSGIETTLAESDHQFLELGFDSLFLTQATQALSRKFNVKLTFRQLMEQFSSIASLADHLNSILPVEAFAPPVPYLSQPHRDKGAASAADLEAQPVERLLAEHIATLSRLFDDQVAALRSVAERSPVPSHQLPPPPVAAAPVDVRFALQRAPQTKAAQELTPEQQRFIAALIGTYEAKTPTSKRLTQSGRAQLADPRAVAGFRPQWKEIVYPLITDRAKGSRIWDVDGNEYIDIVNGYGCIMFGHSPEFVVEAAKAQIEKGVAIGPQTPLAAEVAALICELTGNERVTFCNTGSEAVMAAIRVARTVTGRDKIVYFTGDYHGTFDEVLIRSTPRGSAPVAPGIPLDNVTNVVVLEYGADASLDYLLKHGDGIAAVLIEPVQTRHPERKPFDFIRAIRTLTEQAGTAMILDEVVTGFRLAPGGVQELLGIRADMCTYGKVIGGGHPIGVLSGKAMYLDALDGGAWRYGDGSGPEVGVTFFAGTFVRHPLALAAARSVLLHLKEAGPQLQRDLNTQTARLAESLDRFFVERGVPSRIHHFASWFYFTFPADARLAPLFYYAMRARGIHIQEGYPCFLTTAHSAADIAAIEQAFRDTILELQQHHALPIDSPSRAERKLHPFALAQTPSQVPLTEPQREVFLAAALNDEANCAFNESLTLHLRGPVRKADLTSAFEAAFARHDALRGTISPDGESLLIAESAPPIPRFVDISRLAPAQQTETLSRSAELEACTPFDLTQGPLLRAICYQLATDHFVLLLTAHHIVLDGWSANQVLEEVGRIYSRGTAAELAPLLPFSSYATRERERAVNGDYVSNEVFWVDQFQGRSPRLELPTDRSRQFDKSYHGSTLEGSLGSDLYAGLKRASARAGCSLYVMLLSGFQLLLHRLTGQDEVVVGISTAGQALLEDVSLVGHCVHFLPMLSELTEDLTAGQHLRVTKTSLLDAYDHQEFTYGSLLRKLRIEREPGRLPLIEVQFNLERVGANVAFDGLQVTMRANPKRFVNTDLFLNVIETANDLEFMCDFNTDLFDESTIARWMCSWAELLRHELATPDARIDELNLLSPSDRHQLLSAWNQTDIDFGPFEAVSARFLALAQREPQRIALECGGVSWSNEQLAAYARSLAARLIAEGLQPGGLVGICVERSPEMVGAVLAVMLAGGAYVPLDPRHPRERLQMVLEDSGAQLLLALRDLGLNTSAKVLNLGRDLGAPRLASATWAGPATLSPTDLAYVIYTSGSTGKPKGVTIEHGALINLLLSMQREPGLTSADTLVAITTLAFDIAGLELLLPLITGARLVLATDAEVMDGRQLLTLLERTKATVLQATPGAWRILIDAGWTNSLPLKALCGGEALPRELAEKLLDRASEVWNVYGPTETTIWSSATRVPRGTGSPRIGPPIANTQFYVLDQRRNPTPIGVTGELYIGGAGLARGYWNRPELTKEKFIPNPFGQGRIYATGDLARIHADGSIELLGRADFQVKIRGYRIELAEIEAAIASHPRVLEAVVTAHKFETGTTRLVAYVVGAGQAHETSELLIQELKSNLSRTLPDYLIPNAFVILPALPRNANGKLDRKALPSADAGASSDWIHSTAANLADYVPPRDVIERQLADIWQTTLGLPHISIRANFFSLGVGSLAALRLITKMNRIYAMELGLASLISASTIEQIAELIRTRFAPNTDSSVVPLQPYGPRPPLYIVHGVGGNVVNFYGLSMRVGKDQPVYGIQSQALVANQPALLHLKDMAAHYIADIRKVQPRGPYHLLGYSFGGTVALEIAHQFRAAGEEVAFLGMIDSKSKDYEEQLAQMTSVQTKINRRVNRFRGNTGSLDPKSRAKYIYEKISTRSIRFACLAAATLHIKRVPAFMRSAYDINYVAVQKYKLRPYDGRLILFRASWQGEEEGERDLGWGSIFSQGVEIHDLPGDHERIFLEPNIDQLANSLRESLAHS
jgi:amino acid adenylation domain-containing protein